MRLIDHLKAQGHSNRVARDLMKTGKVLVGGVPTADPGREVDPTRVEVRMNAPRLRVGRDLAIIWRDSDVAVVWKPPNMLSVAAPRRGSDDNLVSLVARIFGEAHPIHRLDEPTSGVMMVGLSKRGQKEMKELLFEHRIERRYLAIIRGKPDHRPFSVKNRLVEDRGDGRRGAGTGPDAKPATTHFRLVETLSPNHALIEAQLETGRTHQVRIHLSERGYPVLGDVLYANRGVASEAPRLALHAWKLGFVHPFTNVRLNFEAPLADDLEHLRRDLLAGREPTTPRKHRQ
ncbi:MAG: RluA family pseudouridine synthase [Myxococcota bacterium]